MFAPLYLKTNNSILKSLIKINELIDYAKKNDIKALTITDENMYGTYDFYKECIKNDIKPIIGLEIKIQEKIVLYAKNYDGYRNLMKLSTIQSEREIEANELKQYSDNLICILPYKASKFYPKLKLIFEDIYCSYTKPSERQTLSKLPKVFMNEILYLEKDDFKYLKFLVAIKEGKTIDEIKIENKNNYLVLEEILKKLPLEDLENNYEIVNKCNVEINKTEGLLPKAIVDKDSKIVLKEECIKGLKRIFGKEVNKIYIDRLKIELDIIEKMGFCDYFLVVSDFISYAKNNNIYIGPGRGSAAGSLVSYLLDITEIDPIKYNLLFERFLNPERVTMPDIDIDIQDDRRKEVIDYCINKYGEKRVVPIISFTTMKAKNAIRDVGRVMNIELSKIDYISKKLDSKLSLKENINQNKELKEIIKTDKFYTILFNVALKLENIKRATSIHAAGVIMCPYEIDNYIPLDKSNKDFYTTAYNMDYLEELGLLKMDFLSLTNLKAIHNIVDDIGDIDLKEIPLNDKKTLDLFYKGDTKGIFQFEKEGMINFLKKLKPKTFEDVYAAIALYRPGAMQFIDNYIDRKNGIEKIDYIDPILEKILKPTYGIMIYQEQVMQVAREFAGYTLGEADLLRRAMGKKKEEIILKQKEKFIKQSIQRGHTEKKANEVYEIILKFASYGFNKSHSVAYSKISYDEAYLKAHYRPYFMKNMLNNSLGATENVREYINDLKKHNIKIIMPSINKSNLLFEIQNNEVIYPFKGIKGIGQSASLKIINERPFNDVFDFFKKCYGKEVNRKTIENLILSGCLDEFNYNRQTLMRNLDSLINYAETDYGIDLGIDLKPEIKLCEEFNSKDLLDFEYELFGFYLRKHPVSDFKNYIKIENFRSNQTLKTVLLINRINKIKTKKNENMLFLTGSDETGDIEMVIFPKTYENIPEIKIGNIILIDGKVDKRDDLQLIINNLKVLS